MTWHLSSTSKRKRVASLMGPQISLCTSSKGSLAFVALCVEDPSLVLVLLAPLTDLSKHTPAGALCYAQLELFLGFVPPSEQLRRHRLPLLIWNRNYRRWVGLRHSP